MSFEIGDDMMGEDSLVGFSLSDLNPITHLKNRARQIANAALYARRISKRIDPVSLLMNRIPGGGGGGGGGSAPLQDQAPPDDSSQYQDDSYADTAGDFAIGCANKIDGLSHHARFHAIRHLHRNAMMGGDFAIGNKTEAVLAMTPAGSAIIQANRLAKFTKKGGIFGKLASILQRSKAGDSKAKSAIAKMLSKAKRGDPKAKKTVANLKKIDDLSKMNTVQRGMLTLREWYRAGIS